MGRDGAPAVTVIIPTRDRWGMLSHALETVLAQERVDLEVVVIDDGSADGTAARVEALGDARIRVVRHETSKGVARARNAGLEVARGEWIAFLDDDDAWAPRKLAEQLEQARSTGAGWAYSAAIVVDETGRTVGLDPAPDPATIVADVLRHNSIPGGCSNVVARAELVRAGGGFDPALSLLADWDLWIRLAEQAPAAACQEPHVGYLDHTDSMHVRQARATQGELAHLFGKHAALMARHGIPADAGLWAVSWAGAGEHRAGNRARAAWMYARAAVRFRSKGMALRALVAPFSDRLVRRDSASPLVPLTSVPNWLDASPATP